MVEQSAVTRTVGGSSPPSTALLEVSMPRSILFTSDEMIEEAQKQIALYTRMLQYRKVLWRVYTVFWFCRHPIRQTMSIIRRKRYYRKHRKLWEKFGDKDPRLFGVALPDVRIVAENAQNVKHSPQFDFMIYNPSVKTHANQSSRNS